ncbi:PEP-CTERM sorting domain-containing protein [Massilia sp. CCM 8695]|uniref:PEP-CTERM sorting domain-containing protein n=2 Tax=Massilia frigida TaxID=2609281 RepID=A0ABX0NEM8_9BURK|nr:PEP-CTERM sorting domain-containing protein [Massilia frigida]
MSGIDAPAAPWTQRNDAQSRLEPIAVTTSYAGSTAVSSADKFGETRTDVRLDDSVGTRGYANGDVRQIMSLTVAPRTQLIYTGYGEVSMSDAAQYGGAAFFGNAVATVTFGDQVWANGMMQDAMGHTDSGVRGEGFYLSFYNNTDTEKYTSVTLNILTRATFIAAAPVPEPATYAMFGLGTLMVGAMARRQRRRQRAA